MALVDNLRPRVIVELGTQYGDSYCSFCQAVDQLDMEARCYAVDTWTGDAHAGFFGPETLSNLRAHHDPLYSAFSTLLVKTFDEAAGEFEMRSIDVLHIDGFHTYEAVRRDFDTWLPKLSETGVVLLHDTNEHASDFGVWRLWQEIRSQYPTFEFLHGHGLGLAAVGLHPPEALRTLMEAPPEERRRIQDFFCALGHGLTLSLQKEAAAADAGAATARASELQRRLDTPHPDAQAWRANCERLDGQLIDVGEQRDRLAEQVRSLAGDLLRTTQAVSELEATLVNTRREAQDTAARCDRLQASANEQHDHVVRLRAELDAAAETILRADAELDFARREASAAAAERDRFRAAVEDQNARIEQLASARARLLHMIEEAHAASRSATREIEELREAEKRHVETDQLRRKQLENLAARLEGASVEAAALRAAVDQRDEHLMMRASEFRRLEEHRTALHSHGLELRARLEHLLNARREAVQQIEVLTEALQRHAKAFSQLSSSTSWNLIYRCLLLRDKIFPLDSRLRRTYEAAMGGIRRWLLRSPSGSPAGALGPLLTSNPPAVRLPEDSGVIPNMPEPPALTAPVASSSGRTGFEVAAGAELNAFLSQEGASIDLPLAGDVHVSVVLLTYNKAEYTFRCLQSLAAHDDLRAEFIIVDNASTDSTRALLAKVRNAHVLLNVRNVGFVDGCNQGASQARGRYVLFLNNDTIVPRGAVAALASVLDQDTGCGAVGGKLVRPDRTLQEAGCIIWRDGSALAYGRDASPDDPRYAHRRDVDFLSAAALLVRKDIFERVGRFDTRYRPAYYEDVDLCLAIRRAGYRVVYEPTSAITHYEYTSSSSESAATLMRRNQRIFAEKWADVLRSRHSPDPALAFKACVPGDRKTVLVVDDRIPVPERGSGYGRAYAMLEFLVELGFRATLLPVGDTAAPQPHTRTLQRRGIEVLHGLPGTAGVDAFLRERAGLYDDVIVSRPHCMATVSSLIRRHQPAARLIYDAEALYFTREELRARLRGDSTGLATIEARRSEELQLLERADLILTVSEHEKGQVLQHLPAAHSKVRVWSHPVAVRPTSRPFEERRGLLFVGGFLSADSPNEDAVMYFIEEVLPRVSADTDAVLHVAGGPPPLRLAAATSQKVRVLGYVPDLSDSYDSSRVFVVPHRFSAGISIKLIEAMSRGIPAVVSPLTARQLDVADGREVLVADTTEDWVQSVIRLYSDPELWHRLRGHAIRFVESRHSPDQLRSQLRSLIAGSRVPAAAP